MTLDVHTLNQALLAGCGVLLVAILAVRGSVRLGLPSLLLYLLIGVGLGDAGLGVEFSDAKLANALGFAALVVILAEGGLTTHWSEMRPVMRLGAALATLGEDRSQLGDALREEFEVSLAPEGDPDCDWRRSRHSEKHRAGLDAARQAVAAMRASDEIGDDAFHIVEEELDWHEMAVGNEEV